MRTLILALIPVLCAWSGLVRADIIYEGDVDPVTGQFWSLNDPAAGIHSTDGDILTVTDNTASEYRFTMGAVLDATTGWTMEVRARNVITPSGQCRLVLIPDGTYDEGLIMGDGTIDSVRLRRKTSPVTVTVDTSAFHVYRITRDGATASLYVDGVLEDSGPSTATTSNKYLRMGSASGSFQGSMEIDYVHLWTSGAYAPGTEPPLNPLLDGGLDTFYDSAGDSIATGWERWGNPAPLDYLSESLWIVSEPASQRTNDLNFVFDGGLRQRIPVSAGQKVTFSCWFNHFFTLTEDVHYQVGIDLDGDGDVAGTIWSAPVVPADNNWHQLTVETWATGSSVMLYTRAFTTEILGPQEHSVFFDDAEVTVSDAAGASVGRGWELYR